MTQLLRNRLLTNGACRSDRLWGAIVKADITSNTTVVPLRSAASCRCARLVACAGAGLLLALATGCHFLSPHHGAEPHYGRLEQGCFGYEPTVWRALPGDCQQAVRMIPDPVVQVPAPASPPPQAAAEPETDEQESMQPEDEPDADAGTPDESHVPGVIRGLLEDTPMPVPESAPPDALPPATPLEPNEEPPAGDLLVPPSLGPSAPPAQEPDSDLRQSRLHPVRPISAQVVDQAGDGHHATGAAAPALFEAIEQALAVTPVAENGGRQAHSVSGNRSVGSPPKALPGATGPAAETVGLAKFIY